HVDNDPGVSATSELFALACGPTSTPISVNSCVVNDVRFVVHSRDERRTTQNSDICLPGEKDGEMYYGRKVKHLVLRNNVTQILTTGEVDIPTDIIDLDEDDDIINDEDALPYDLAYFDDEDLVNVDDDDGVDMSTDVARATTVTVAVMIFPLPTIYPLVVGLASLTEETRNLELKKITDDKGLVPIRFEWDDKKTLIPLGDHASHWSNYLEELIREMPLYCPSWQKVLAERKAAIMTKIGMESLSTREYPSLIHTFFVTHTVGEEEMLRLQALGSNTPSGVPYTEEEINALARKGKQRGYLPDVGRHEASPEFDNASGSGGYGDDEIADDEDDGEDEEDEEDGDS
nr:hypothetical protein [Tanacetum cinerariifolium]